MDVRLLKSVDLFAGVDDPTLAAIAGPSFLQNFPNNVVLCPQGGTADFLFVLVDGLAEMRTEVAERQHTLQIVEPPAVLLTEAVVTEKPSLAEYRTIAASRLLMIPGPIVRWAMASDVGFCRSLLETTAMAARDYMRQINGQKLRTGVERLAAWALDEWARRGHGPAFPMRHSKRVLANLLGMTPENLSRTLSSLEPLGLRFEGRQVEINDPDRLREIAQMTPLMDATA